MSNNAEVFASFRPRLRESLMASSEMLQESFGNQAEQLLIEHIDTILDQLHGYLSTSSQEVLAGFVQRWIAVLRSGGLPNRSILRAVVTLGGMLVQAVKRELGNDVESQRFVREIVRLNFLCVRSIVEVFAADVKQRQDLLEAADG